MTRRLPLPISLPILALTASLALSLPTLAAEPRVTIAAPAVAKVANLIVLDATQSEGDDFVWESTTGESFAIDSNGKRAYFVASVPGKYRFLMVAAGAVDGKARLAKGIAEVIVDGIVPPTPVPPGPSPTPTPTPIPPGPSPTPTPVPPTPSTVGNLRVLVLFESSAKLDMKQVAALNSGAIRKYLSDKCLKDTDGLPAWRMWDQNIDASVESPAWKAALDAAQADKTTVPKVAIFAGTTLVKVVPLPGTADEMLAMLTQWGGK